MRRPHKTKIVELLDGGVVFPLKSDYDRSNFTLEGIRRARPPSILESPVPDEEDVTVRVIGKGDRWTKLGKHWRRIHELPRN